MPAPDRFKNLRKHEFDLVAMAIGREFQRTDVFRSCITCLFWSGENGVQAATYANRLSIREPVGFEFAPPEMCIKHRARPPAKVIANGCDAYYDEAEIPF